MDAIILQVEFPNLGVLKLGDSIFFQENTGVFEKVAPGEPKGAEIIAYYTGNIRSFEIGTNVMQGTHGIMFCCENIKYVKSTHPAYNGRETIIKMVNSYKNAFQLLS